ncbi:hypothetical protein PPH41_15875, partial [Burkholderia gladioli]|nr:hypothetical protein [Burkholderia gladioli]
SESRNLSIAIASRAIIGGLHKPLLSKPQQSSAPMIASTSLPHSVSIAQRKNRFAFLTVFPQRPLSLA